MYYVREIRERIGDMIAEPSSERGQEKIHEDGQTHVLELWEDGEVTSTKCGDLYRARSVHQSEPPFIPEGQVLFSYEECDDDEYRELRFRESHKRMIILDREVLDILAEYREIDISQELIEHLEETGFSQ